MTGRCPRCEQHGTLHRHHPTGRHQGTPHHPGLVDTICTACHTAEHRVWTRVGLDDATGPDILTRRLAVWLGRYQRALPPEAVKVVAVVLAEIAEQYLGRDSR